MLEFIVGYALGSSANNSAPLSGKQIAIIMLVAMAFAGGCYLLVPIMFSDSIPSSTKRCGGMPIEVMMCNLSGMATTIGMILVGTVALIATVWFLFAAAGSSEK